MLQRVLSRNIILYLVFMLILVKMVNWDRCLNQRGKYLLGIFYNGNFKNKLDGQVYQDYLKRHHLTHEEFRNLI